MANETRLAVINADKTISVLYSQPKTKYELHNFCAKCVLWYPKELGGRCIECRFKARTKKWASRG